MPHVSWWVWKVSAPSLVYASSTFNTIDLWVLYCLSKPLTFEYFPDSIIHNGFCIELKSETLWPWRRGIISGVPTAAAHRLIWYFTCQVVTSRDISLTLTAKWRCYLKDLFDLLFASWLPDMTTSTIIASCRLQIEIVELGAKIIFFRLILSWFYGRNN